MTYFLDPATFMGMPPEQLIDTARLGGYDGVGMFLHSTLPSIPFAALAQDEARRRDVASRLKSSKLRLGFVEVFDLSAGADTSGFAAALACAASLGAMGATAVALQNDDWEDLAARFSSFADLCANHGLRANVEFFPLSRALPSLELAARLVRESGRVNGGLTLDILHLVRSRTPPAAVSALPPSLIGHVQVCDGPAEVPRDQMGAESRGGRFCPGKGEFDLAGLAAAMPTSVSIGVEVPHVAVAPAAEAAEYLAAARRFF